MSDLEDYLKFVRPWDDNSYKVVTTQWLPKDETSKKMMLRGARSFDDIVGLIQFYDGKGENVWFSTQTFAVNPAAVAVGRGRWFKGVHRKQQHLTALYNFYVDLDVKETGYPSIKAAAEAIVAFCTKLQLPPPSLLVCSGYGLHVYWRIQAPMTLQQWQPIANALRNAMIKEGIHADHACTIDGARILRPAGTRNWKNPTDPQWTYIAGGSRQVYPFEWFAHPLRDYTGPHLAASAGKIVGPVALGATIGGINRNLSANVNESQPVDLREVATECGVFAEQFNTHGATASQPLWSLIAMATVFDHKPWETFEQLSNGYPSYDENAAKQKLAEKMVKRQQGGGWPSCSTFSSESSHCLTCPHFAAGKSPLNLRAKPKAAPGVLSGHPPSLPSGYWQEHDGSIWTKLKHAKTEELVPVCALAYAISDGAIDEDTDDILFTAEVGHAPRAIRILKSEARSHDIRNSLCRQGVTMLEADHKKVGDFIVAWVTHLRDTKAPKFRSARLGWNEDGSFTHGETTWVKGKPTKAVYRDTSVSKRFVVKGDPAPWDDIVDIMLKTNEPALEVGICSAFAAPLVQLSGNASVLLSLFSGHTASAKTTVIRIACAVWGHPIEGVNQLDDTDTAMFIKAGMTRSLPMLWDEIGQGKSSDWRNEKLLNTIFRLGQGRDKDRARADLSLRDSGDFQTMMVTAGNRSLAEKVIHNTAETDAGVVRVFEVRMPDLSKHPVNTKVDHLLGDLRTNFGYAGAIYAQWLTANRDAVKARFKALQDKINASFKLQHGERFWSTTMTALLLGAECADKAGIVKFNEPGILRCLKGELENQRAFKMDQVAAPTSPDAIAGLIGKLIRERENILHTDILNVGAGGVNTVSPKHLAADLDRMQIWGQYADVPQILRVIRRDFELWIAKQGQSPRAVVEELRKLGARDGRHAIGTGTLIDGRLPDRPRTLDIPMAALTAHLP